MSRDQHKRNSINVEKITIKESKPEVRYMCKECCGLELERMFNFCPYCGIELRWD